MGASIAMQAKCQLQDGDWISISGIVFVSK